MGVIYFSSIIPLDFSLRRVYIRNNVDDIEVVAAFKFIKEQFYENCTGHR